jgi:hypothetical protein
MPLGIGTNLSHPVLKTGEGFFGGLRGQLLTIGAVDLFPNDRAELLPHFTDALPMTQEERCARGFVDAESPGQFPADNLAAKSGALENIEATQRTL